MLEDLLLPERALSPLESHRKGCRQPMILPVTGFGEAFGPEEKQGGFQGPESNRGILGMDLERKDETQRGEGCTVKEVKWTGTGDLLGSESL